MTDTSPRRFRVLAGGALALELRDEPGVLISVSAPPPAPGTPAVTHPFAAATFHMPENEGALGELLRSADSTDAFLRAVQEQGFDVEAEGVDAETGQPGPFDERAMMRFVEAAARLSTEDFARVGEAGYRLGTTQRLAADRAASLSSDELELVQQSVQDALRPRMHEFGAYGSEEYGIAVEDTILTAHGVARRALLSADEYEILTAPFRGLSVPIPSFSAGRGARA